VQYFGERLKEERIRIGLSQEEFAKKCAVSKRSQINYEQSERAPDLHYLSEMAGLGGNVDYVVTGKRQGVNEDKLRDSLEVVFNVLSVLKETNEDISNERAAQLVAMIYDLLAKGKALDENDLQWLTKMAS
jgi:transcriptional regulator with XRE-family HTH domain